eukprot:6391122-Heterocapsa_arctica.AAC.1
MSDSREAARRVYLRKTDLEKHSAKRGCQGSDVPRRGHASSRPHKKRGRERMDKKMGATAEGVSRVDRAARRHSDTVAERSTMAAE